MSAGLWIYVAATALAAVGAAALAVFACRHRRIRGAAFLAAMLCGAAVWCVAAVGVLLGTGPQEKLFWARVSYMGIAAVPWGWLLFVFAYTGSLGRRVWPAAAAWGIVPAMTLAFVLVAPRLPLVWTSVDSTASLDVGSSLAVVHGPWFWIWFTYVYGCLGLGCVVLLRSLRRMSMDLTVPGVAVVLAVGLPWVAHPLTVSGLLTVRSLSLTPSLVAAGAALATVVLLRSHTVEVLPGVAEMARAAAQPHLRDGVLSVAADGCILSSNAAGEALLAPDAASIVGRDIGELMDTAGGGGGDLRMHEAAAQGCFVAIKADGDGEARSVEVAVSELAASSRSPAYLMLVRDISEQVLLESELTHRATHDDLTGLPNRSMLHERLAALLPGDDETAGAALLVVDLDDFKFVNDSLGHEAGDAMLVALGRRIQSTLRQDDFVARLGGDEFAVVLPGCCVEDAVRVARELRETIMAPVALDGQRVCISAAVGVAVSTHHGGTPELLLRHADVAMYAAKSSLHKVAAYRLECDSNSRDRLAFVNDLRAAIRAGSLSLHYQPQVALADHSLARFEALARWRRDDGRLVASADFIPLIEQYGLLPRFTEWAIDRALRDCSEWAVAGHEVDVAVNLSALDLGDLSLVSRVSRALREGRIEPQRLWLEITETSAMSDPEVARRMLTQLRAIGVGTVIDDFGIGRSSLGYLKMLPADGLKIDKVFVSDLTTQPHNEAIVRAAVALAHELDLSVTAEGVETAEVLEYLRDIDCDLAQGYHIARPMPAGGVVHWLRTHDPKVDVESVGGELTAVRDEAVGARRTLSRRSALSR